MGSSGGSSAGETVKKGLCFPMYQAWKAHEEGNDFDAVSTMACPVGVGAGAQAIKAAAEGDYRKAAGKAGRFALEPFGFGAGIGGEAAGEGIYDFVTKKDEETDGLETDTKEDPVAEEEQEIEEEEEARDVTNAEYNTARKAAYQAAINAGATPAQAQAMADSQTPIGNAAGNLQTLRSAGTETRAQERERAGYADALAREAKNLNEGRKRAIAAAALGGAGTGAQTGLSVGSSLGGKK
jgi:hypothetical protein